ncbi:MAG: M17 family peptidase N-terminal domain-containing protein, partial [Methyloceanibacter sp.]
MELKLTNPTTLTFASPTAAAADGIAVVFAEEGNRFSPAAQHLDKKTKGLLRAAAKIAGFKGKRGASVDVLAPQGVKFAR